MCMSDTHPDCEAAQENPYSPILCIPSSLPLKCSLSPSWPVHVVPSLPKYRPLKIRDIRRHALDITGVPAQAWSPSLLDLQLATVLKRRFLVLGTECTHNTNPQMPCGIFMYILIFKPSHPTTHSVLAVVQKEKLTKNIHHIPGCCFLFIYRLNFYCISSYLKLIPLF